MNRRITAANYLCSLRHVVAYEISRPLAGSSAAGWPATAMEASPLTKIPKPLMARMLHVEQGVAQLFVTHLLYRNIRYEADLVDQLFNSSERRRARIL